MKPHDLLDDAPAMDDADPTVELDELLKTIPKDVSPAEKLPFLDQIADLLGRSPLGAVDIYAPDVRQKLGFTKDTLVQAVLTSRAARRATRTAAETDSFEPSPDDLSAAETLLKSPKIEDRLVEGMAKLGVVGEVPNIILLLLTVVSRLLRHPICLVLKSVSSAGKSFLMNMVLSTLPAGESIVFTAASAKALYFRTDSLAHKVLVFMERPGAEDNDYQVRVLQSEGKLIYSVAQKDPDTGQIVTEDKEIEGPVAYIETTTQAVLHDENETRLFSASLDESAEATGRIIEEQARRAAMPTPDETKGVLTLWRTVHTLLNPADVVIPFAEKVAKHFPRGVVRARRDFPRFLSLIEAAAVLYQHQRDRDSRGAIIATYDDYSLARRLAVPLLESAILGAGKKTRELVAAARELARAERPDDPSSYTITSKELTQKLPRSGWSRPTVRRHLKAAEKAGYLDLVHAQRGEESEYRVVKPEDDICIALPDAEALDRDSAGVDQPDQGASNPDDALNSNDSNDIVEVNQPNQGVGKQIPLFDEEPEPTFRDPDFA